MSSSISTPAAHGSEAGPLAGRCWRVVEAQHRISTMKLTDSLAEQEILEGVIERTKPPLPDDRARFDFLLMTPFRYSAANPFGSRFRKPFARAGVFYASEHADTAIAEMVFHRLMFFAESPATPWPINAGEYTAFAAEIAAARVRDVGALPSPQRDAILDPESYVAGQAFADAARQDDIEIIRYPSVRDPEHRANLAVLTPRAFAQPEPAARQSWRLHLDASGARAICEAPRHALAFARDAFDNDSRMRGFVWVR